MLQDCQNRKQKLASDHGLVKADFDKYDVADRTHVFTTQFLKPKLQKLPKNDQNLTF